MTQKLKKNLSTFLVMAMRQKNSNFLLAYGDIGEVSLLLALLESQYSCSVRLFQDIFIVITEAPSKLFVFKPCRHAINIFFSHSQI